MSISRPCTGGSYRCIHRCLAVDPCSEDIWVAEWHDLGCYHARDTSFAVTPPKQVGNASPPTCIAASTSCARFLRQHHGEPPTLWWISFLRVELRNGVRLLLLSIGYWLPGKIWHIWNLVFPPGARVSEGALPINHGTYISSTVLFLRMRAPVLGLLPSFSRAASTWT